MTNPTTPFSWQMPTATDLVTDLPADFETFGQAVATSMADLLGGTTGQVLSKASNTDMDFTWVAQDDSNAIQNAIVDAKGDIITATAADTPARLAVGTNGQILVADSSTATGLKWATATSGGLTLIASGTLSGTSVVINSIPSTYKHLMVSVYGATWDAANDTMCVAYNSVTTNYTKSIYGHNGTTATNEGSIALNGWGINDGAVDWLRTGGANHANWTIYDYTNTTGTMNVIGSAGYVGSSSGYSKANMVGSNQATAAAVTSLTIRLDASRNMTAGSYKVYGVS